MFKFKRVLAMVLVLTLGFSLAACNGEGTTTSELNSSGSSSAADDVSSNDSAVTSDSSETSETSSQSVSSTISSSGQSTSSGKPSATSSKPSASNSASSSAALKKVFKVESFGAKGDGKTDDGVAISKAIMAAAQDDSRERIVEFRANATYRVASAPANNSYKRVMNVINCSNLKIQGNNTKLLMKAPYRVAYFTESENIEFSGFVIDYSPKPFTVGQVIAINSQNSYIDFATDDELGFEGEVDTPSPFFAFRNKKNERLHYTISGMKKLGAKKYRLFMTDINRLNMAVMGEEFILPVYGSSHNIGGLFSIQNVKNFEMKNVKIYAMPDFGFDIRSNTGYTKFTNVRIEPAPGSKAYLASWRDGFHVKDNLSKLIWDNCYIGPLGDDAFNISAVICNVNSFNMDLRTISMTPAEGAETRDGLKAGDELVAYNMKTGEYIGEAKIEKVLPSNGAINIKIDRQLPKLTRNSQIAFYAFNKDFVVKNSYIEGTVRVRSSGSFQNCEFNVFWVRVENESYVEGPVPKNVTFKSCTFTTPYNTNPRIFHVGTLMATGVSGTPQYKSKNIVLDGCKFLKGTYGADAGNELIVK